MGNFLQLVKEFTPEVYDEVRDLEHDAERLARFARTFGELFFPLPYLFNSEYELDEDAVQYLLGDIPIECEGLMWDDIEEIHEWDTVELILCLFCRDTYVMSEIDEGETLLWQQECLSQIPLELLQEVWELHGRAEWLHYWLDGSPYAEVAAWADRLNNDTGNNFMDTTREADTSGLSWTRHNVLLLTAEYQRQTAWWNRMQQFEAWLMRDPAAHVGEILAFIRVRQRELGSYDSGAAPESQPLIEMFVPEASNRYDLHVPFMSAGDETDDNPRPE